MCSSDLAAQAAQPGVARGKGIGQILQPAGAAAPAYMKSMKESEALAREMESNDQKLALMGKQFEMSQKAGDRKTAMELATTMEAINRQNATLAETIRHNKATEGLMGQRYAAQANRSGETMARIKSTLAQKAQKLSEDYDDPLKGRTLKQQYPSRRAYAKSLFDEMWSQSMPLQYQGTLDKDEG